MKTHLENTNHDYLRYANCWEDADRLLAALDIKEGDRVLSIGSAGDNSFSLLLHDPQLVIAVDINSAQLHLIELKKAAFRCLDYSQFLEFLGFKVSHNRLELYNKLSSTLPVDTRKYWNSNIQSIDKGIIHQGKFEKYFKIFRTWVLPLIHSRRMTVRLLAAKSADAQAAFVNQVWNSWGWKCLFKLFFSKSILGRFGRDPEFLREVKVSVGDHLFALANQHLSSQDCQTNYFLYYIFFGKFGSRLPHYARPENFERIRQNINALVIHKGFAQDVTEVGFTKFNLSNIFEYMDEPTFHSVANALCRMADTKASFVYWNLMVPRSLRVIKPNLLRVSASEYKEADKGFFYSNFHLNTTV